MPTFQQRLTGIAVSAGILIGGAWLASKVPSVEANEVAAKPLATGLEVTVEGVRNGNGQVIVMVMDNRDALKTYDYQAAVGYLEVPASTGRVLATFPDLTSGPFAVVAIHDENGNRDLDMKNQIPTEGYMVSGARDAYDEPPFSRAASDQPRQTVRMFYLDRN
ncbi:DUF2141 domain-containing protein [Roseibium sp.]|uniref:DUF2141 domain-containing protein n=1 Tax=Roseibium sp. TaxID=1936156 RepID=UPI0039EEEDC5